MHQILEKILLIHLHFTLVVFLFVYTYVRQRLIRRLKQRQRLIRRLQQRQRLIRRFKNFTSACLLSSLNTSVQSIFDIYLHLSSKRKSNFAILFNLIFVLSCTCYVVALVLLVSHLSQFNAM